MGVGFLKIVGRGGPTAAKVANVALVHRFRDGSAPPARVREAYREHFGRACRPLVCYLPELHPDTVPGQAPRSSDP